MEKFLVTFEDGGEHNGKCLIVKSDSETKVRDYVNAKYGKAELCAVCDYSLFSYIIRQYGYKVMERVKVWRNLLLLVIVVVI